MIRYIFGYLNHFDKVHPYAKELMKRLTSRPGPPGILDSGATADRPVRARRDQVAVTCALKRR